MYFNNIHIIVYLVMVSFGCIAGQIVGNLNERLALHKEIFSKQGLKEIKINFQSHYMLMTVMSLIYIATIYVVGIDIKNWYANIDLVTYLLLIPMLVSALIIDYKHEIIPNRLVLCILELGLISLFANGICNPNGISIVIDRVSGMFLGAGIFLIITLLGGIVAGKEAMGMGDVKFIGSLGLIFGINGILVISVLSFLIGAILSILIVLFKIKKPNEYIPFGPFIVISVFIAIFIPEEILFNGLWWFFSGQWFMKLIN